jgi:hypothetical protein
MFEKKHLLKHTPKLDDTDAEQDEDDAAAADESQSDKNQQNLCVAEIEYTESGLNKDSRPLLSGKRHISEYVKINLNKL